MFLFFSSAHLKALTKASIILLILFGEAFSQSMGPNAGSSSANKTLSGSTSTTSNVTNALVSDNSYSSNTTNLASNGDYSDYLTVITITEISGKIIFTKKMEKDFAAGLIRIEQIPFESAGLYFLLIEIDGRVFTEKFRAGKP